MTLNYQPLENSLNRKRMMYAKMLQQGFTPQKTEMVSGIAIPNSKTQGFSDILKVGLGSYFGQKADEDLMALQSKKTADKGRIFAKLMGLNDNTPQNGSGIGSGTGSGNGGNSLSADEISFMQQEMPDIGKAYLNNKLADQRLTTEQKNAISSGYKTPLDYWQGKQDYSAEIKDNALTNEQKNAEASGFSNPFAYQNQLKGVDYGFRKALQDDSQDYGREMNDTRFGQDVYKQNRDFGFRAAQQEDSQDYDKEKRGDVLVKAVINGVEYEMPRSQYDAILNNQYNQSQGQQENRRLAVEKMNARTLGAINQEVNPFTQESKDMIPQNVSDDVVKSNMALINSGNSLIGDVPTVGRKIVSPIESGRKKLEITNANNRLAEKEKNLRGYSAVLDNLQRANELLNKGDINVGAWDGTRQFIDKNIPYFGNEKTATNTEIYEGLLGDTAAQALKLFGGSDSNMELEFSKAINAGDTNMSKEALQNLIKKVQRRYAEQVQDFDNEKKRYENGDYLPDLNRPPKVNLKDLSNDDLLRQLYE